MESATNAPACVVNAGSHLTLHYRISLPERDVDVISTFGGRPATLQVGVGQMAEPLEQCLLGLAEGAHEVFDLAAESAFGPRNPELVQKLSRKSFDANVTDPGEYHPGDLVDIPGPEGNRLAGVLKEINEHHALFDFNHPLAGQRVRFEIHILGIL